MYYVVRIHAEGTQFAGGYYSRKGIARSLHFAERLTTLVDVESVVRVLANALPQCYTSAMKVEERITIHVVDRNVECICG
jgi:hypothetical protein